MFICFQLKIDFCLFIVHMFKILRARLHYYVTCYLSLSQRNFSTKFAEHECIYIFEIKIEKKKDFVLKWWPKQGF